MIYNILRNRLKPRINKSYSKWLYDRKKFGGENHHILKSFMGMRKLNDYMQVEISSEFHQEITYRREPTEDEFIDMLVQAIENMSDYIDYLEVLKLSREVSDQVVDHPSLPLHPEWNAEFEVMTDRNRQHPKT